MEALQTEASNRSGVSIDEAFEIDHKFNVYERIGGVETIKKLSRIFYDRVYDDTEQPWFTRIFDGQPKEMSIQNQYEFFSQRWVCACSCFLLFFQLFSFN
jgi:hypothetical protein